MITWEEAESKIAAVFAARYGRQPTPVELHGMAAVSSIMSNFGYHLNAPDKTDHNWSGWLTLGKSTGDGWSTSPLNPVRDEAACAKAGGSWGAAYNPGQFVCYTKTDSDESGINGLLNALEGKSEVRSRLAQGDVDAFVNAFTSLGPDTNNEWPFYHECIYAQFSSGDEVAVAFVRHLQDLEMKTGMVSGWTIGGKPVGSVTVDGYGNTKMGGGAVAEDEGTSLGGWLVGGAIAATALGLLYAATKAK